MLDARHEIEQRKEGCYGFYGCSGSRQALLFWPEKVDCCYNDNNAYYYYSTFMLIVGHAEKLWTRSIVA